MATLARHSGTMRHFSAPCVLIAGYLFTYNGRRSTGVLVSFPLESAR